MGAQKKGAGIDEQNPKRLARTPPVELRRAVGTEHPAANDDGIEGEPSVTPGGLDLLPVVADVSPEHVVAEVCVLNPDAVSGEGRGEKSGEVWRILRHQALLASFGTDRRRLIASRAANLRGTLTRVSNRVKSRCRRSASGFHWAWGRPHIGNRPSSLSPCVTEGRQPCQALRHLQLDLPVDGEDRDLGGDLSRTCPAPF